MKFAEAAQDWATNTYHSLSPPPLTCLDKDDSIRDLHQSSKCSITGIFFSLLENLFGKPFLKNFAAKAAKVFRFKDLNDLILRGFPHQGAVHI